MIQYTCQFSQNLPMQTSQQSADFETQELPFFGYNSAGLALGDDTAFRLVTVDEELNNQEKTCDPLVEIKDELLKRPLYHHMGWTDDSRLFLRQPALTHLIEYDQALQRNFGWRLRVTDAFRPWIIQQRGFCWGVNEVIKNKKETTLEEFLRDLKIAVAGLHDEIIATKENQNPTPTTSTPSLRPPTPPATLERLEEYLKDGDEFFVFVNPKEHPEHENIPEILIAGAANFSIIPIELERYALTPHSTGGVIDMEWVDQTTGKLINMGVPVDTQGLEGAMPFFEDRNATILKERLAGELATIQGRKFFYRQQVQAKPTVQEYLQACGVDLQKFFNDQNYFDQIFEEIKINRRKVVNLGESLGIKFYGLESWHADCNDQRGGVRHAQKNIISGGAGYAVQKAQAQCAWGNATKLWEKLQ